MRVYGADLVRKNNTVKAPGKNASFIALSPDETRLAVGYLENRVDLFSTKDMSFLATADASGGTTDLSRVAWTRDGFLYGSGKFSTVSNGDWVIRRWNSSGRRQGDDRPLAKDTVTGLVPCGSRLAFSSADPSFGLIDPSGPPRTVGVSATADMRNKLGNLFQVSADRGKSIGLDFEAQKGVLFELTGAKLSEANKPPAGLTVARTGGMPVGNWNDSRRLPMPAEN